MTVLPQVTRWQNNGIIAARDRTGDIYHVGEVRLAETSLAESSSVGMDHALKPDIFIPVCICTENMYILEL